MIKTTRSISLVILLASVPVILAAQDTTQVTNQATTQGPVPSSTNPFDRAVFPANGQTPEQQMSDQLACYNWAGEQTGWDPQQAYAKLESEHGDALRQYEEAYGGAVKGAARGALMGLAIGAIAGDAGEGAAIGAVAGGGGGAVRSRRQRKAAEGDFEAEVEAFKAEATKWDSQWTACMKGKDYSVE